VDLAVRKLAASLVGGQTEELEEDLAFFNLGDEGAAALAAYEQMLSDQRFKRLADCALAYAELLGELLLARQGDARWPGSVDETGKQRLADLLVERPVPN